MIKQHQKKTRVLGKHETAPGHTNTYVILIKHKETKMVSDGIKVTGIELI